MRLGSRQDFLLPDPEPLREWRASYGNRENQSVNIVTMGHSILEGYFVTAKEKRYQEQILHRLRGYRYKGDILSGIYHPPMYGLWPQQSPSIWYTPWTLSGGYVDSADHGNFGFGFGRKFYYMTATTHSATYNFTGTSFTLYYTIGGGVGGISIAIDGGAATIVDSYSASVPASGISGRTWSSPALTAGPHTVVIKPINSGAGTGITACVIDGAMHFNNDEAAGVRLFDGAHQGFFANHFAGANNNVTNGYWRGIFDTQNVRPDLVILQFGTNEYGSAYSTASFYTDLQTIVTYFQSLGSGWKPSILLLNDWGSYATGRTQVGFEPYRQTVRQIADDYGCAHIDLFDLGGWLQTDPYSLTYDKVHSSDRGADAVANYIATLLGAPSGPPMYPENWHFVGQTGEPAFQNSWVNGVAAGYVNNMKFRREGRRVFLEGYVTGVTNSTTIFQLPAGYRPARNIFMVVPVQNGYGLLTVGYDGSISVNALAGSSTGGTFLSGVNFPVDI